LQLPAEDIGSACMARAAVLSPRIGYNGRTGTRIGFHALGQKQQLSQLLEVFCCSAFGLADRCIAPDTAMRQSEFDKITAALGRAEFALEEFRKRADELRRKSALAKSMEEIAALNVEAAELVQQLEKISVAVHSGNPAPHLRLVSDKE
jgi:hypothetical protein